MTLATGTLLLFFAVIPGFSCLFGFYSGSRLGGQLRDVTPKSQAGEIAMVLTLSLLVHVIAILMAVAVMALAHWAGLTLPSAGFESFFDFVDKKCVDDWQAVCRPSLIIAQHYPALLTCVGYVAATTLLGFLMGHGFIWLIENHFIVIRRFHSWAWEFTTGRDKPLNYVTVLTNISQDGHYLGYRGILVKMNLDAEQNLKTVLLCNVFKVFFPFTTPPSPYHRHPPFSPLDPSGMPVTAESHNAERHANGSDILTLMIPASTILNFALEVIKDIEEDDEGQDLLSSELAQMAQAS